MPSNKDEREDLAWVMCVLMMSTRQLALINKTGQVNFEINLVCRMFIEWVRNMIQQHFSPFFSSMLLLSYDRVIAGYLTIADHSFGSKTFVDVVTVEKSAGWL